MPSAHPPEKQPMCAKKNHGLSRRAHSCKNQNGWLDPEGVLHPLDAPNQHCKWCVKGGATSGCQTGQAGKNGCALENQGWFKLTNGKWIFLFPFKLTKKQCDYIFDWHIHNEQPLDEFIRIIKGVF
ncbi:MAG: hypothetical protein PHV34_13230 [Verrucomicrobiae bacterium]|nr:hypothetical protein [Verrucomicrobiae bacterium]